MDESHDGRLGEHVVGSGDEVHEAELTAGERPAAFEPRADEQITADAVNLLWYRSDLAPADLSNVHVRARGGIVELHGHTRDPQASAAVELLVQRVRGVRGVRNYLNSTGAQARAARAAAGV